MTCIPQSDSPGWIGLLDAAPYSHPRRCSQRTVSMSQLARLIQIAGIVMAIVFFAVALRG
jgi:hypothetical protein